MGIFRPAAKVVAPDGRTWELYSYRFRLRKRRATYRLLGLAARPLVRVLWDAPRAAIRTIGSDEWTVEAICWLPRRESYAWRTTGELRGNVLAQLEGQLARGESPKLSRATYLGASR